LEPPFFFFLKSSLYGFYHKVFERRLGAGLQSYLIIHRNPHLVVLYQLNILHCIDRAVVGPHVEAVPLVDFVLVLFGDLLHHLVGYLSFTG